MAIYRLKRSLTSGELSPLMYGRTDLDIYKNGCKTLLNAYIKPQGPVVRRPGTQFIENLTDLFTETIVSYRLVDFVFDETQAYCIIFLTGTTKTSIYFASYDSSSGTYGLIEDPSNPGTPYSIDAEDTSVPVTFNFSAADFDYAQSKDVLFIAYYNEVPLQLVRTAHDSWSISSVTFSGTPSVWGAGDYPKHVSFYEQRLVFANSPSYPQYVWFSETGNYYNMTPGTSGTDPIEIQIKSERNNQIQWLSSGDQLFVGSIGDEWTISGGGDYFSIETIQVDRHSAKGGEAIRPVKIGSSVLYIERLGRVVNEFAYDYRTAGYNSVNVSILAPHLTDDYGIIRWAYQAVPNSVLWCVKSNGQALALTFQREHQVTGWAVHETEGLFKDVCCIPDEDTRETNVWFLVERTIDGSDYLYLERMKEEFLTQDAEDAWMVDCGLDYDVPGTPVTTVSGLDHLEGEEVAILTNGAVHANQTVESGSIDLNFEADRIIVGLPYTTRIEPMPIELQLQEGTSVGRKQRITNINVYLHRSLGMWIGRNMDEMEEVPFRVPTDLTGQGVPLFSGIRRVAFPEGYDNEAVLVIEQRQPLPMLVVSIMDELEVYS